MKLPVFKKAQGFTLIELLVVIALIGILAVAVLSALNPIEQANKAKDAKMSADASQLLSAIDRYYAGSLHFPWTYYQGGEGVTYNDESEIGAPVYAQGVGVCGVHDPDGNIIISGNALDSGAGVNGCADTGYLIDSQEMKTGFSTRDYFSSVVGATGADKTLWLYKPSGDPTVYICFKPASKANKDKATVKSGGASVSSLKYLTFDENDLPTDIDRCDPGDDEVGEHPTLMNWDGTPNDYCFVCVPE